MNSDSQKRGLHAGKTPSYSSRLHAEFTAAIRLRECLQGDDRARAEAAVAEIQGIRALIYREADRLGYATACVDSIPDCKGECCKWHYPKTLNRFDFFITVVTLSPEQVSHVLERLEKAAQVGDFGARGCPFLTPGGCVFSFQSRPILCANAYPCFMSDGFHAFLETRRKDINRRFDVLRGIERR